MRDVINEGVGLWLGGGGGLRGGGQGGRCVVVGRILLRKKTHLKTLSLHEPGFSPYKFGFERLSAGGSHHVEVCAHGHIHASTHARMRMDQCIMRRAQSHAVPMRAHGRMRWPCGRTGACDGHAGARAHAMPMWAQACTGNLSTHAYIYCMCCTHKIADLYDSFVWIV
eukprot:356189-Chlamydomonas_euryale.AAC.6